MSNVRSGAKYIAETFNAYGIEYVFFIPAILRRTMVELEIIGIKRILGHCEKAIAYMADGYARISQKPGIVMAQSVGAANLAAGLQDAYKAHSSIIAITGRKPPIAQYRNAYQEIIHFSMFDPVTKYNVNIDSVDQLPTQLRQTFRETTSGAPRPVHLDMLGLAGEVIEYADISAPVEADTRYERFPAWRIQADEACLREAVRLLESAAKPVIVAGGGAIASSCEIEIVNLAQFLDIPVASSCTGKAIIPNNHPLSVGVVGSYSMRCANEIVSEADLVIYVGCSVGDQVTHNWTIPADGCQIIQIDINPSELGRNYRNTLGILGDAKMAVSGILKRSKGIEPKKKWAQYAKQVVEKWRQDITNNLQSDAYPMRPERLCNELSMLMPRDAILVADTGYSAIWTCTMIDLVHPEQSYIRSAGSLGWAFPASLGAYCAAPKRPVICFTGDGGIWYHIAELETARRRGLHTVTIVNNNSGFSQSRVGVNRAYSDTPGKPEEIYCFEDTDFAAIAKDMGCLGIRVESPEELIAAFREALKADVPALIDVVTDATCTVPEIWEPSSKK